MVDGNSLIIAPKEQTVQEHVIEEKKPNGNSKTQQAINLLLDKFKGKRFDAADAAGILGIDRDEAAKIVSYAKSKGLLESHPNINDKRLRTYSVV